MRRARERIDLAAGIVDVIFARHGKAGIFQRAGQRIADDRAAAMPHVHRPGRVGADIFDIDRLAGAQRRAAIIGAGGGNRGDFGAPHMRVQLAG